MMFNFIVACSFYFGHLSAIVEKAKGDGKIGELMLEWYNMMILNNLMHVKVKYA